MNDEDDLNRQRILEEIANVGHNRVDNSYSHPNLLEMARKQHPLSIEMGYALAKEQQSLNADIPVWPIIAGSSLKPVLGGDSLLRQGSPVTDAAPTDTEWINAGDHTVSATTLDSQGFINGYNMFFYFSPECSSPPAGNSGNGSSDVNLSLIDSAAAILATWTLHFTYAVSTDGGGITTKDFSFTYTLPTISSGQIKSFNGIYIQMTNIVVVGTTQSCYAGIFIAGPNAFFSAGPTSSPKMSLFAI